ncbi:MAG: DUF3786 domain-containing protein [Anaerolinea sp.]|nr:DUF3786 domain-containing protein [Anaerolinea sp.]
MKDARDHLARRVAELHDALRHQNLEQLAHNTGARYEDGRFHLTIWGTAVTIAPPDFNACDAQTGEALDGFSQALLAYYFTQADGTLLADVWIAFTELPDAQFYTAAFQGYTGNELAKVFGNEVERLAETAVTLGGQPLPFADRAFAFRVLPNVAVMVACWLGDEDFPPSYRILFDANTRHHLPTDACAIIGSTLTRRLIRGYNL